MKKHLQNHISLFELQYSIKNVLSNAFDKSTWIVAEISEININRSGHCYLELVESEGNTIKAKARATIWAYTFRMLKPYFESITRQTLEVGLTLLINVDVVFHEQYGYSLNVKDIDPTYTLGDQERKRQEIIKQLEDDGVLKMNAELNLPVVIQKIAIISSESAAGYGDFMNQLNSNSYSYKFYCKIFNATMQGEKSAQSIIEALDKIFEYEEFFDVVVILRGGGSKSDLGCFDNYDLAYMITQFPLPILTGIGHERDETIADIVSNKKLKTPTAVADFLIENISSFEFQLNELSSSAISLFNNVLDRENNQIFDLSHKLKYMIDDLINTEIRTLSIIANNTENSAINYINNENFKLDNIANNISLIIKNKISDNFYQIQAKNSNIKFLLKNILEKEHNELIIKENTLTYLNPYKTLNRGYSLTYFKGKVLRNAKSVKKGDLIKTLLYNGTIDSEV